MGNSKVYKSFILAALKSEKWTKTKCINYCGTSCRGVHFFELVYRSIKWKLVCIWNKLRKDCNLWKLISYKDYAWKNQHVFFLMILNSSEVVLNSFFCMGIQNKLLEITTLQILKKNKIPLYSKLWQRLFFYFVW